MNINNIIRLTASGSYLGTIFRNVYHFRVVSIVGAPTLYDFVDAWRASNLVQIRSLQNTNVQYSELKAEVINHPDKEFVVQSVSHAGTRTGSGSPSFMAISIRLAVGSRITRGGYKRLVGVNEEDVSGQFFTPAFITAFNSVAPYFVDDLNYSFRLGTDSLIANQIILGKILDENTMMWRHQKIIAAQIQGVTTQNTRKIGRGE